METTLQIGWAQTNITPDRPVLLYGQMYYRVSSYVHDPITATAVVFENFEQQLTLVSLDIPEPPQLVIAKVREMLKGHKLIDPKKISFNVTHTHNAPSFEIDYLRDYFERFLGKDIVIKQDLPDDLLFGEEATAWLSEKLYALICKAWDERKPGGISAALDYAAVAFNRRPVFDLGNGKIESKMYGAASVDNFIRMEGTADHTADMLYTWDGNNEITGVLVNIPCPSQVFELHDFISADYWAPARNHIREELGNLYVLPLCGAAGDQNPLDLVRLSKTNVQALKEWNAQAGAVFRNLDMALECNDIGERIAEAVCRGYRKARNYIDYSPVFRHEVVHMSLPIRTVDKEEYIASKTVLDAEKKKYSSENRMTSPQMVAMFEPIGDVKRWQEQQESTMFNFEMHVVRFGRNALVTNPFELFVDFGMRIKARSKADQTFIVQLSNNGGGYLPTDAAVNGGSYSSKPASTTCDPKAGDKLVEKTLEAIANLW